MSRPRAWPALVPALVLTASAALVALGSSRSPSRLVPDLAWHPPSSDLPFGAGEAGVDLLALVAHVPVVHFGDLDPNGLRIYDHLRAMRSDLVWFVPDFWAELVEGHGLSTPWPEGLHLDAAPALVRDLAARGRWLEQERIVLDPRMAAALEAAARKGEPG